jgi:hypothetical protein
VERPNHLPLERFTTVVTGGETTESFRLLLAPGAVADVDAPGVESSHQGGGLWLGRPWPFWVVAGVAVVAGGTGAAFGLDAAQRAARVNASYDAAADVYRAPRSEAVLGQRSARLANTFFIVAGAAAVGAGILFVALPAGSTGPAVKVQAALGVADGPGVLVRGSF